MRRYGPALQLGGERIEGHVEVDGQGRITAVHEGDPGEDLDGEGLVTPWAVNAHTHIADIVARGRVEPTSVEEVFAPPDGGKHRILRQTSEPELMGGMIAALREASEAGVARLLDFREGGPRGAHLARQASKGADAGLTVLGRPSHPGAWEEEASELEGLVDGLGISGLADQPLPVTRDQAAWCHVRGLLVALHLSETRREDLDEALALTPDLLVHGTFLDAGDVKRVADEGTPLVVCPRSNALFGNTPPVADLVAAGAVLGLGTDNAMFQETDVWTEAAFLLEHSDVPPEAVLDMLVSFPLPTTDLPRLSPGARAVLLDPSHGLASALRERRVAPIRGVGGRG